MLMSLKRVRYLVLALLMAAGIVAAPGQAVAASSSGQFHVFSVSPGGNLFQDVYASGWSGWQSIGNGGEALAGTPAVAYDPDNGTYHVFVVGRTSGNVYQVTFVPGQGWGTWQNLGGTVQDGLTAVYENGYFAVWAISPSGNLFQDTFHSSWSGWQFIGNGGDVLSGAPAVAYDGDNGTFHVFAVGSTTQNVFQVTYANGSWGTWQNLGGTVQPGLSAFYQNGTFAVWSVSPAGNLFQDTFTSHWSGWQYIGNGGEALGAAPAVVQNPSDGTFHAFARGVKSGNVYQVTYVPGQGWIDWQNLGGVLQGGIGATYS